MILTIDEGSATPIYAQIASAVRREVSSGRAVPGDRLPAARDLADALGVNLHTVLRGYRELREGGVVDVRRGRGAVVAAGADRIAGPVEALARYVEAARRAGLSAAEASALVHEEMS